MTKAKADAKATFSSDGVSVSEFAAASAATGSDYILSSSSSTVDPEQLREILQTVRAQEQAQAQTQAQKQDSSEQNTAEPKLRPGRGQVFDISLRDQDFVLRKYRRGGLVARVSQFSYLWTGLKNSRAFKELSLLDQLSKQQLPVCRPEAAWVLRKGLFYQAYLLTEKIPNAKTLGELFVAGELSDSIMYDAGTLIRRMHNARVWHADLNAHNILFGENHCVLIDFDRGRIRNKNNGWRQANIQRLRRSFEKLAAQHSVNLTNSQWQALLSGYETR